MSPAGVPAADLLDWIKPLDFVRTPQGAIAIVSETCIYTAVGGVEIRNASIAFLGDNTTGEKGAWWSPSEGLVVIDNLPRLLATMSCHPFGKGRADAEAFFSRATR